MSGSLNRGQPYIVSGRPGVTRSFADGFRLVADYPGQMLGPMFAILVPVAVVIAIATAVLYLTTFDDRDPSNPYTLSGEGSELFLILVVSGIQIFFSVIAGAATIAAAAACARGAPLRLVEALDVAFSGIGRILLLLLGLNLAMAILVFSIIGIPVALYLAVRLVFAIHSLVLESPGVPGALSNSWDYTRGNFLPVAGLLLLAALALVVAILFASMLSLIEPAGRSAEIVTIAGVNILQSIIIIPIEAAIVSMMTLFYLNLKAQEHDAASA